MRHEGPRFSRALVRPPGETFSAGLTSGALGPPDVALALRQHEAYCRALERAGLRLTRLPPDPDHPDSTFVEDTAVITPRGAILARPGAPSRAGEVERIRPALEAEFGALASLEPPAALDGGDVCQAGDHYLIGVSARTNREGARQLATWLGGLGLGASVVDIRPIPGLLHLKTGLSWLGGDRLLVAEPLRRLAALARYELLPVPAGEDYAANSVVVGGSVIVPAGYPGVSAMLRKLGFEILPVAMSEFRKMDGGVSCLSLRW